TVAVVGLSDNPDHESHRVARYLQQAGYTIIPVNPNVQQVLGERAYPDLQSVPVPIDVVDVFRRSAAVPGIIEQAMALGIPVVWLQRGVTCPVDSRLRARKAGITLVEDSCLMVAHRRWTSSARGPG
ncbi:MAG: CoA-binding protein, partial [Syntrophomonadaceae bacterium]|nr:CoA-binding protein [Syntrophomonadaceae bacterium]